MLIEASTHLGLVRENNEDRFLVKPLEDGSVLLALADGMGGHASGEVAAELALECLRNVKFDGADLLERLLMVARDAQDSILEASRLDISKRGMGTTLTAAIISGGAAYWLQVGDSRLYLFRSGELEQITSDQTIPGKLYKEGRITKEQARLHPYGNVLLQCVGCEDLLPETGSFEVEPGDLLMLSSDGLHDLLSDREIAAVLALDISLKLKLDRLTEGCLLAGGKDNITAILGLV